MNYLSVTVWVFIGLILMIGLMTFFPTPFIIGLGAVGVPVVIAVQTYMILRTKEPGDHSSEDKWYENP